LLINIIGGRESRLRIIQAAASQRVDNKENRAFSISGPKNLSDEFVIHNVADLSSKEPAPNIGLSVHYHDTDFTGKRTEDSPILMKGICWFYMLSFGLSPH
jgi:hypothetical protein